jgi:tetratricopeptide (TPR) repeat protein
MIGLLDTRPGRAAFAVLLGALLWLAYGQTAGFDFISYDTRNILLHERVTAPPSPENLWWLLTHSIKFHWTPLAWYSHVLDYQLFGPSPGAHHLSNAVYHLAAALLLFGCLRELTGRPWRSAIVALLFAVHPLRVESVAWVVERKDVLSAALGFAAVWAYAGYARRGSRLLYALSLLLFSLSLLAKSMLVTLPLLLLVVDFWPLRRLLPPQSAGQGVASGQDAASTGRLLLEKLPFALLSAAVSYITIFGVGYPDDANRLLGFGQRLANAVWSYGQYLRKLFAPTDLSLLYAHPYIELTGARGLHPLALAATALLLVAITALCLWQYRRRGYLLAGWLWFAVALLPVIGIAYQAGLQGMADRFTYLPSMGILVMVVWGAADWIEQRAATPGRQAAVAAAITGVVALSLTALSYAYVRQWRDSVTLYRYVLQLNPAHARVHHFLGEQLVRAGRRDEGVAHLERAATLDPGSEYISTRLGVMLAQMGRYREAARWFRRSLALAPQWNHTRVNLAAALAAAGDEEEAAGLFREAVARNPRSFKAVFNLALLLARQGKDAEALRLFARAASLKPDEPNIWLKWAELLLRSGRPGQAADRLRRALELDPHNPAAAALLRQVEAGKRRVPEPGPDEGR